MLKGEVGQALRITVIDRKKLRRYARTFERIWRRPGKGYISEFLIHIFVDWMAALLPQTKNIVFRYAFCSSPDPGDNWRIL